MDVARRRERRLHQDHDFTPGVGTDGRGKWIVAWAAYENLYSGTILAVRSSDDGQTWSGPIDLGRSYLMHHPLYPLLAADESGTWVAVWQTYFYSSQPYLTISTDGGSTTSTRTTTPSVTTTTSTTSATMTSTTMSAGCDLIPPTSMDGVVCALATIEDLLTGTPQLECTRRCRCTFQAPLRRVAALITAAEEATSEKRCRSRLAAARRTAKALRGRVMSLVSRHCIAPIGLGAALVQETRGLSTRSKAVARSSFCADR